MANARTVQVIHDNGSVESMDIDEYAKGVLPCRLEKSRVGV